MKIFALTKNGEATKQINTEFTKNWLVNFFKTNFPPFYKVKGISFNNNPEDVIPDIFSDLMHTVTRFSNGKIQPKGPGNFT